MCGKFTAMALWALALTLPICFSAACSRDNREADMKQCVANTQRDAAQGKLKLQMENAETPEERHDAIGRVVAACMKHAGYKHVGSDLADARCVEDVEFNPYCYRRAN